MRRTRFFTTVLECVVLTTFLHANCNSDQDAGICRPNVVGAWEVSDPSQFGWFATSNGVLAAKVAGFITDYTEVPLTAAGKAALKPGANVIAVHCHQTGGGQYIDAGLVEVKEALRR